MSFTPENAFDSVLKRNLTQEEILQSALNSTQTAIRTETSVAGAATSDTNPLPTKGVGYKSAITITRPSNATAYTAGDVIGDTGGSAILSLTSAGPSSGHLLITDVSLLIALAAVPSGMTTFRLELYDVSGTAIADNAVWDLPSGDRTKYLGSIALGAPIDKGATLFARVDNLAMRVKLTGGSTLYGQLVTEGAFTPTSAEVYILTVGGVAV